MAWQLPGSYTLDELIDMAQAGWEGVLDSYLAPFTWITALITAVVVIGLGVALGATVKNAWASLAFIALGLPLSLFSWWQIYWAVLASLGWMFLVLGVLLVAAVVRGGIWMAVPVGLVIAILAGLWWLYPDWFLPAAFF